MGRLTNSAPRSERGCTGSLTQYVCPSVPLTPGARTGARVILREPARARGAFHPRRRCAGRTSEDKRRAARHRRKLAEVRVDFARSAPGVAPEAPAASGAQGRAKKPARTSEFMRMQLLFMTLLRDEWQRDTDAPDEEGDKLAVCGNERGCTGSLSRHSAPPRERPNGRRWPV